MNPQSRNPIRLLKDSRTLVTPIHKLVLLLFIPYGIFIIVSLFIPNNLSILLGFLYGLSIQTISKFSAFFYIYQYLINSDTTIYNSLKFVIGKYLQILLCNVLIYLITLPAFLLLIVPGIYVSNRLAFAPYAIVIENCSAADGIRQSWQLVKGKWWSVFWALLVVSILLWIPIILIPFVAANAFSVSGWEVFLGTSPSLYANIISSLVVGAFILMSNPILIAYELLLYMNLRALRSGE
ncbi:hypothetical protein LC605_14630 [Nostoc sp. CHAB 5836]|uniref:hypothetical protein n=1 Tax=Nostoc sp. CHAB 5836 TaxID=2780404 RepID=UPI001E3B2A53|nr:hypothetical protein [Nostoc sp. CHAB 5836]MCC5616279.1 hypothetical protein [Nostoc sp. CHAB 5836]